MPKMFVDFINNTGRTWTMGLYQTLPDSTGLESVAWLATTAPDGGETGVDWAVDYQAMLANYKQVNGRGVYKASQKKSSLIGKRWRVVFDEGVQQLVEDGEANRPDQIIIANDSGELATPGIGMSGQGTVFKHELFSGSAAQFIIKPTYHFGLFNDVVLGEVISSNVIVGPQTLVFEGGLNAATITASVRGNTIHLDTKYGRRDSFLTADVERHLAAFSERYPLPEGAQEQLGAGKKSGTLAVNGATSWERNLYKTLSVAWTNPSNPGTGVCNLRLGDDYSTVTPPASGISVDKKAGKLTNNTSQTISYTLS
jgi:hypothetical protein